MAINYTPLTQLSTFSTIRTMIRSDSTLASKFSVKDFYEFEPNIKQTRLPFIIINVPASEEQDEMISNNEDFKDFTVEILLFMEYSAKDNYSNYASRLMKAINDNKSSFNTNGYYEVGINHDGAEPEEDLKGRRIIVGTFTLTFTGFA